MIICITGKSGSGKTTAAKLLTNHFFNANLVDADKTGWEILEKEEIKSKLVNTFGRIIIRNGKISRNSLGKLVFSAQNLLKKLNSIVHPALIREIRRKIQKGNANIIDAALYYELGLDKISDFTILLRRPRKKAGKKSLSRGKFQKEPKKYDFIISNNGSISDLRQKVKNIAAKIKQEAR